MNVAVMGYGTVGSGVVRIINEKDLGLTVKYILDLRDFPGDVNASKFTKDFNDILTGDVDIVVETMGGQHPAFEFVSQCLAAGKHVVTSNKELVAEKGLELITLAKENDVNFMFEAAVGGGIPVIRPLTFCLRANNIRSVNGILNGTTNFILTKMIKENMSFEDALKIAQDNGYAEKDPTADVEGHDSCRKICILAALAFGNHVYPKNVHCEGITKIALEDVANVSGIGAIKLIGTAEKLPDGKLYILVSPAVVLSDCQLSAVSDVFNAVMIDGDATDEVLFYGKGAGSLPTASAVVADVLDCAEHSERRRPVFW
ncbi:MAG: homoserine dehydrogenase, partial [Clostridia bacterium]|nr:homoserine dehydrogenase [Clostridia bacterium]